MKRMLSAYLLALISGTQGRSRCDGEAQQLRDLRRRQHQLEHAAIGGVPARAAVVAQQAQDDREAVVDRQERLDPALAGRSAARPGRR